MTEFMRALARYSDEVLGLTFDPETADADALDPELRSIVDALVDMQVQVRSRQRDALLERLVAGIRHEKRCK